MLRLFIKSAPAKAKLFIEKKNHFQQKSKEEFFFLAKFFLKKELRILRLVDFFYSQIRNLIQNPTFLSIVISVFKQQIYILDRQEILYVQEVVLVGSVYV